MITKAGLRRDMKARLEAQSPSERRTKSLVIQEKFLKLPAFRQAACISFFVSTLIEVDTHPLIDAALLAGKKVVVPLTDLKTKTLTFHHITSRAEHLRPGVMGILEPHPEKTRAAEFKEIDAVVVPGLLFDKENYRIGFGAGLYDRFLAKIDDAVPKIGLAYAFQIVEQVPREEHDRPVTTVLTEKE